MKNIFYLLFLFPIFAHAQFTELAPMPERVSNNAVVAAGANGQTYVYSFAGIDSTKIWSGIHLKSWRYDVANDEWAALPDVPDPEGGKIAASASVVKGKIYLIGGYHVASNGNEASSMKTHVFDPAANAWLPDAADIPLPIDDHVQAVWRDSLIFVVTGWSNTGNVANVQIFNPAENEWTAGTPVPNQSNFKVFGGSGAIIDDTIYYAGGAKFAGNFPASAHFRKGIINPDSPTEIEWSGWAETNAKGYRMAAVASGGKAYWLGGSEVTYNFDGIAYNGSGGVPPLGRILAYDPATNGIFPNNGNMPPVMDLRGGGQITENQVVIAGGMEAGQQVTNRTWLIDIGNITAVDDKSESGFPVKYFPNPAAGSLTVEAAGEYYLKIYGAHGKLIFQHMGFEKTEVETSGWESGNYWIELARKDGRRETGQVFIK